MITLPSCPEMGLKRVLHVEIDQIPGQCPGLPRSWQLLDFRPWQPGRDAHQGAWGTLAPKAQVGGHQMTIAPFSKFRNDYLHKCSKTISENECILKYL